MFRLRVIDGAPAESPLRKALETGAIVQLANHTDLISRTGERRNIADSAAPIRNPEDGSIAGGVLVFRDVTEDYRTLDRLRANSVILKSVAKIAKILYFRHGENGVLEASGDPEPFWRSATTARCRPESGSRPGTCPNSSRRGGDSNPANRPSCNWFTPPARVKNAVILKCSRRSPSIRSTAAANSAA